MGRDRAVLPHPARQLTAALVASLAAGCSGSEPFVPPGAGIALTVQVYLCSAGCGAPSGPVDTVSQGDTALIRIAVADTAGNFTIALIRPPCGVNITILGGSTQHTLPAAPTCPDSGISVDVGSVPYLRDVVWNVNGLAVGDYTLRGDIVVDPPVSGRRAVHVR